MTVLERVESPPHFDSIRQLPRVSATVWRDAGLAYISPEPKRRRWRRVKDSSVQAVWRARRKVRLYARANALRGFVTLTFAEPVDRAAALKEGRALLRRCRRRLGRFPWVMVAEESEAKGWHLHLMVPGPVMPMLKALWDKGFEHEEYLRTDDDLSEVARYVSKDFAKRAPGERGRRYFMAPGFMPDAEHFEADSIEEAVEAVRERWPVEPDVRPLRSGAVELIWPVRLPKHRIKGRWKRTRGSPTP